MGMLSRLLGGDKPPPADRLGFPDVPRTRPASPLQARVDEVRVAVNQLSNVEYGLVLGALLRTAPTNLLVFGLGRDSDLWAVANRGGRTAFLEDVAEWFRDVPGAETHLVGYPGLAIPEAVRAVRWDVILVDGPMGFKPEHPGRGESIRAAAELAAAGGVVFVHDYDRPAEREFAGRYLGPPTAELDRLGVFVRSRPAG